jgi:protein-S-isoprenylcysteine O-methyltransferase Ste14
MTDAAMRWLLVVVARRILAARCNWVANRRVIVFAGRGKLLSWSGASALDKQWRVDAGINADHELVTIGSYHLLRHPIYASMLSLLVGTGLLITPWSMLLVATLVFIVGTEIRISIEDGLLAERFGERFPEYQRTVPAYIPFLR